MTDEIRISGRVTREDFHRWMDEVRENRRRLASCPRHRFAPQQVKLGQKVSCLDCAGSMDLSELAAYVAGYEAAGRSPDDIWPGYHQREIVP